MRTTLTLLLTVLLASCSQTHDDVPSPSGAADGTDLDSCKDLHCEVYVNELPQRIPLNDESGMETFTVEKIDQDVISLHGTTGGGYLDIDTTTGSPATMNAITVTVSALDDKAAILKIRPLESSG